MGTGEDTDVEITQSLSSAEVAIGSYLQKPVQPRKSRIVETEKRFVPYFLVKTAIKYLSISSEIGITSFITP